jgi:hypothetical protein
MRKAMHGPCSLPFFGGFASPVFNVAFGSDAECIDSMFFYNQGFLLLFGKSVLRFALLEETLRERQQDTGHAKDLDISLRWHRH